MNAPAPTLKTKGSLEIVEEAVHLLRKTSLGPFALYYMGTLPFVLGMLSFCVGILAALPAVILGIVALVEISRSRGRLGGKGLAITGLILGCVGLVVVPVMLVFAIQRVRDAATNITSRRRSVFCQLSAGKVAG